MLMEFNYSELFFLYKTNSHKKTVYLPWWFWPKKKYQSLQSILGWWWWWWYMSVFYSFVYCFFLHISLQIASIHHHRLFHYVVSIWWWWNDWNSGGSTIGRSGQSPRAQTKFFSSFSFNGGEREKLVQDVISAEGP